MRAIYRDLPKNTSPFRLSLTADVSRDRHKPQEFLNRSLELS